MCCRVRNLELGSWPGSADQSAQDGEGKGKKYILVLRGEDRAKGQSGSAARGWKVQKCSDRGVRVLEGGQGLEGRLG